MSDHADTIRVLSNDLAQALEQLTVAQARGTQLLEERRALSAVVGGTDTEARVLADVVRERRAQDGKWGPVDGPMLAVPDGTGSVFASRARVARMACDEARAEGRTTWRHVLDEEASEAFAESDPDKLRAELIQVAAVAIKWVEVIDRRAKGEGP